MLVLLAASAQSESCTADQDAHPAGASLLQAKRTASLRGPHLLKVFDALEGRWNITAAAAGYEDQLGKVNTIDHDGQCTWDEQPDRHNVISHVDGIFYIYYGEQFQGKLVSSSDTQMTWSFNVGDFAWTRLEVVSQSQVDRLEALSAGVIAAPPAAVQKPAAQPHATAAVLHKQPAALVASPLPGNKTMALVVASPMAGQIAAQSPAVPQPPPVPMPAAAQEPLALAPQPPAVPQPEVPQPPTAMPVQVAEAPLPESSTVAGFEDLVGGAHARGSIALPQSAATVEYGTPKSAPKKHEDAKTNSKLTFLDMASFFAVGVVMFLFFVFADICNTEHAPAKY